MGSTGVWGGVEACLLPISPPQPPSPSLSHSLSLPLPLCRRLRLLPCLFLSHPRCLTPPWRCCSTPGLSSDIILEAPLQRLHHLWRLAASVSLQIGLTFTRDMWPSLHRAILIQPRISHAIMISPPMCSLDHCGGQHRTTRATRLYCRTPPCPSPTVPRAPRTCAPLLSNPNSAIRLRCCSDWGKQKATARRT